jgi:mRNA-degrading endonuclease YafQ of YafQ-DinJ toxin-antitoxin module
VVKSKYQLQIDNLVIKEDLPLLPIELLEDFTHVIKPLMQVDPLNFCGAYSSHKLLGQLQGYRALEIDFGNNDLFQTETIVLNTPRKA